MGNKLSRICKMKHPLTQKQIDILRQISPLRFGDVVEKVSSEIFSDDEIDDLCYVINEEFMSKGLLPTFEPNKYGIELEDLMDIVNRPRLDRSIQSQ